MKTDSWEIYRTLLTFSNLLAREGSLQPVAVGSRYNSSNRQSPVYPPYSLIINLVILLPFLLSFLLSFSPMRKLESVSTVKDLKTFHILVLTRTRGQNAESNRWLILRGHALAAARSGLVLGWDRILLSANGSPFLYRPRPSPAPFSRYLQGLAHIVLRFFVILSKLLDVYLLVGLIFFDQTRLDIHHIGRDIIKLKRRR